MRTLPCWFPRPVLAAWLTVAALAPAAAPPPGDDFDLRYVLARHRPTVEAGGRVWEYELEVTEEELRLVDGTLYKVWAFGGRVPGPTLVAREGDHVRIRLINSTSVAHTIHSHGLWVPHRMDGVTHAHAGHGDDPALPPWAAPVPPGGTYTYEYIARPAGTHFYHCHVSTNEHLDRGMSGALIVLPATPDPPVDRDVILLLDEWDRRVARGGSPGLPREMDGYDIFTLNGRSFPETAPIAVSLGAVVRLRFINTGALTHSMHLHGHSFLVTHKDGWPLPEPQIMDTVPVAPGERVDVVLRANNPGEWPLHCHTAAHQTNAGLYPGGMMTHLIVGPERYPGEGEGPVGEGIASLRETWRRAARRSLGLPG